MPGRRDQGQTGHEGKSKKQNIREGKGKKQRDEVDEGQTGREGKTKKQSDEVDEGQTGREGKSKKQSDEVDEGQTGREGKSKKQSGCERWGRKEIALCNIAAMRLPINIKLFWLHAGGYKTLLDPNGE